MSAIFRSVLSISAMAALSRVTGYARTVTMAAVLGVGVVANAYTAASFLPIIIYELFLGGILYSIFIPLLIERITAHGEQDARDLTNALLTVILPLLAVVATAGIVFAEPIVRLATNWTSAQQLSPTEARDTLQIAVLLFRIFVTQIFLYGINAIVTGVLNSHRRFFLPNFAPVLVNLVVIGSLLGYALLAPGQRTLGIYLLAVGPTVGLAAMMLVLLGAMRRLGYRFRPRFYHPALLPAAKLAGPMLLFVAASVGVQFFANRLGTSFNAAPQLLYAFTIFSLPYGIFVVSIATALMPELSEKHSRGDTEGYRETLSFGLRTMMFLVVPATVGLVTLATPIVGILYQRGRFDPAASETVAALLVAYSVGLLGYAAYFILVRAFYSRQNTKIPAVLNAVLLVLYVGLAYLLKEQMNVFGVAFALSVANTVLALLCLAATRRDLKRLQGRRLLRSLGKVLVCGGVMYAAARVGTTVFTPGPGLLGQALVIAVVGGGSLAAYLGAALLLRAEELDSAVALFRRRFVRTSAESNEAGEDGP